jgi:hypothetical protein
MSERETPLRLAGADAAPSPPGTICITPASVQHSLDLLKAYFTRHAYEIGTFQPTGIPSKAEQDAHTVCVAAARVYARDGALFPTVQVRDAWKRGRAGAREAGLGPTATQYAINFTNFQRGIYPDRPHAGNPRPVRFGDPQLDLLIQRSDRSRGD